jgi:hypothetical protein
MPLLSARNKLHHLIMNRADLKTITNSFRDVRLLTLAGWRQAKEINPRDHGGPYVVLQEGFDPEDSKMLPDEFVLGRSGKWLSLGFFYKLPVPDRRAEYVFGTAAEVMQVMEALAAKVSMLRPGAEGDKLNGPAAEDEMGQALHSARGKSAGSAS